jgi:hypothetical protein
VSVVHSAAYTAYLLSETWRSLKRRIIKLRGYKCEWCKVEGNVSLQLHHLTYERLGCELDTDVQLLCSNCHFKADQRRAEETQNDAESRRYYKARETYIRKAYGNSAADFPRDYMIREFDKWFEEKEREERGY